MDNESTPAASNPCENLTTATVSNQLQTRRVIEPQVLRSMFLLSERGLTMPFSIRSARLSSLTAFAAFGGKARQIVEKIRTAGPRKANTEACARMHPCFSFRIGVACRSAETSKSSAARPSQPLSVYTACHSLTKAFCSAPFSTGGSRLSLSFRSSESRRALQKGLRSHLEEAHQNSHALSNLDFCILDV